MREATLPFTVTKSVNPTSAGLNDTVTYTVVLNNTSANTLSNATFVDQLPAGLEYVPNTLTVNGQVKAGADPNTQFTIDDIPGNGNVTVTFDAKVVSLPDTPKTENTAQFGFSYTPISGGQAQTLNLSSTEANPLYIGDAVIGSTNFTKTAGTQSAKVGDEIPYTIAISNGGNVNATNVTLTDALPPGTTLVADSLTVTNKQTGTNVDYTGDLASGLKLTNAIVQGAANEVDISYKALLNTTPATNTLTNTANLSYQYQRNPNDPTVVTQTGTTSASVNVEDADNYPITITKTANPANNLVVGDVVTYTVTVENTSTNNATYTNTTITDTLPDNLTYERGSVTINGQTSTQELTNGITLENDLAPNTFWVVNHKLPGFGFSTGLLNDAEGLPMQFCLIHQGNRGSAPWVDMGWAIAMGFILSDVLCAPKGTRGGLLKEAFPRWLVIILGGIVGGIFVGLTGYTNAAL